MVRKYKRYDEYKDSGVEWIGEIPESWETIKLKFLLSNIDSGQRETGGGKIDDGVFSLGGEHIGWDGNLYLDSPKYVSEKFYRQMNSGKIAKKDILLVKDGATIGKTAYIDKIPKGKSVINEHVYRLSSNNKIISKLLYFMISGPAGLKQILLNVRGAAQGGLNLTFIDNLLFSLPPKSEQQKIASFLDQKTAEIDEITDKKEKLIDYLEKYKKSVITEAVTRGKLGDKYIDEDGELVDEIEMKDSGTQFYGNIPKHLIIKKMKYITKAIIDGAHLTPTYVDDGVPFLRVTDISEGNDIDWKNTKQIPLNEHKQLKARTNPEKGDLLVSKNGTIGKTRVITWDKEFSIFVSLCLLKFVKEIDPFYIAYFFKSYALDEQIKLSGKTNTITNLHLEKIRELELLIPEQDKLQKMIVNYLDQQTTRINNLIQKTKQSIEKYKEYKKSLIFEAVTGKIDLRDYELEGGEELAEHNNSSETERECLSAVD